MRFTPEYLNKLKNFTYKGKDAFIHGDRYNFFSERGDEGYIVFLQNGDRYYFLDDFPSSKKSFRSNIPLKKIEDFRREAMNCGIKKEWMNERNKDIKLKIK